jgi:hypothetical protein
MSSTSTLHTESSNRAGSPRRVIAAVGLVLGPASLIVGNIVQWTLQPSGSEPTAVDVAAQFPTAWLIVGLLSVFGPIAWLVGLPAVAALARGRGAVLTSLGVLVTAIGLAAGVGHLAAYFSGYGSMAASGLSASELKPLVQAADAEPIANALLMVFLVGYALGPIVLTIGLRVAHRVAVWVPIAAIITAAASFLGGPIAGAVQLVTLVLVWAPIVIAVTRGARQKR